MEVLLRAPILAKEYSIIGGPDPWSSCGRLLFKSVAADTSRPWPPYIFVYVDPLFR